jgi:hypothetical protein
MIWSKAAAGRGLKKAAGVRGTFILRVKVNVGETRTGMTYARSRLWLGITGVGTWTTIAAIALWQQWRAPVASGSRVVDLAVLALLYILIQAPFDWLGGYYLPKKFARVPTSFARWAKGVVVQAVCWVAAAWALWWSGATYGGVGAGIAMVVVMLTLVMGQGLLASAAGSLRVVGQEGDAALVSAQDPAFAGGWVGLGPWRRLVMPVAWRVEWRAVQRVRRTGVIASGARAAGLTLAMVFNVAGLLASLAWTPGAGFSSTDAYLRLVFGFTLWSFAGLLVLPSLSRPAVFAADRFAAARGVAWEATARELDRQQDDEPARAKWIERIFHPVPALGVRLRGEGSGTGAWQAARLALYLSWSVPGLLSRSVHCNVGRPEVWVLFPGD